MYNNSLPFPCGSRLVSNYSELIAEQKFQVSKRERKVRANAWVVRVRNWVIRKSVELYVCSIDTASAVALLSLCIIYGFQIC